MPGQNKILKPNDILFKQGDQSNGMFLIRKGNLKVYLEKNGRQIELAQIGAGGMIGEMALFDQKPRSATVKAEGATEVTHVTKSDFDTLLKQIPKWFTALMITLSGRLRSTNERLEKLEALHLPPMQGIKTVMRILVLVDLLFHRDGEKIGKEWFLDWEKTRDLLLNTFSEDAAFVEKLFAILKKQNLIKLDKNSYGKEALIATDRGVMTRYIQFLADYIKLAKEPCLSEASFDILKVVKQCHDISAYDNAVLSFDDVTTLGAKLKVSTLPAWSGAIAVFRDLHPELKLTKTSEGHLGFKVSNKDISLLVQNHQILRDMITELAQ